MANPEKDDAPTGNELIKTGKDLENSVLESLKNKKKTPAYDPYKYLIQGFSTPEPPLPSNSCSGSNCHDHCRKTKAKRTSKSERNEIPIDVKQIDGFRGADNLEDLLKYIEDPGKEPQTADKKKKKQPAKKNKKKSSA